MNIDFEYTAQDTHQKNYPEDLRLLVLENKGKAMMYCANVPTAMRYQISPKAFETVTFLEGVVVAGTDGKKKSIHKNIFGKEP